MSGISVGSGTGAPGPSVAVARIRTFLLPSVIIAGSGTTAFFTVTLPSGLTVISR